MQKADGMNYAPEGCSRPVCNKGEFRSGIMGRAGGYLGGTTNGLVEAGRQVGWLPWDDPRSWSHGRLINAGTEGCLDLHKYVDVARDGAGNHIYLANHSEERYINAEGTIGFSFFGELILDSLNRARQAMPQEHTFKAAEHSLIVQQQALHIASRLSTSRL